MYKAIYLAKRNPAISAADFPARWRAHSALAANQRNRRTYFTGVTQCCRLLDADFLAEATSEYDAVNLLNLTDLGAADEIWEEPGTRNVMQADELLTFSRPVIECWMTTEASVVRAGPITHFPIIRFLKRASGIELSQFLHHWTVVHALLEIEASGGEAVRRYVQNRVIHAPTDFPFDLITETWFATRETMQRYCADRERLKHIRADMDRWCHATACVTMMANVTYSRPALEPIHG